MRIAVSAGHNVYIRNNFDVGSVVNGLREADITKETVKLLIPMLQKIGHTVIDVTPYNEKFNNSRDAHVVRCKRADDFKADLFIDVHVNASTGAGTGVECWVYSTNSKSYPYADRICKNISDLGLSNRGVKVNSGYWTVALGRTPAVIVEGGFIDNANDMKILTPLIYARSICEGVTGKKISDANYQEANKKPSTEKTEGQNIVRIKKDDKIIEVEGYLQDGSNFVKVREVFEKLGHKVSWDSENKIVVID